MHLGVGGVVAVVVDESHRAAGAVEDAGGDAGPETAGAVNPQVSAGNLVDAFGQFVQWDVDRRVEV